MKKGTAWWLVFLVVCLKISILHAAQQPVIVLQANESSPYWSQKLPFGGMGGEIVQAISKEMGMKTRIEFRPLKRMIADTANNDLGNPLFYMNNQDFEVIIPIAISYNAFFSYHKGVNNLPSSATEVKGKRIGILKGVQSDTQALARFGQFEESYSRESLFKKLKAGRVDFVLELDLVGRQTISTLFPNEIDHFDVRMISKSASPIAIMIDARYPNANDVGYRYREGLYRIQKNGVYRKILKKYYGKMPIPIDWYDNLSKFETIYAASLGGDGS